MKYSFKEAELPSDFCKNYTEMITSRLHDSSFFTIRGMKSVGISFFLRHLITHTQTKYIYIDILSLATRTKAALFKEILRQLGKTSDQTNEQELLDQIKSEIASTSSPLVFIFNRFDELGNSIDHQLLSSLRSLRHSSPDTVSMIFTTHTSLLKKFPEAIKEANLDMFSNLSYFQPYANTDLASLLTLHSPELITSKKQLSQIIALSGGHYQLAKLLLKSETPDNPLSDLVVLQSLKSLSESLSYTQKKQLQSLVMKKTLKHVDPELLSMGIIKKNGTTYEIFSPLLTDYTKRYSRLKLPVKEAILFRELKKNLGKVVTKEVLFQILWSENEEEFGSDWALNSLIYRLRKNPTFQTQGFVIENYKKVGYVMIKE